MGLGKKGAKIDEIKNNQINKAKKRSLKKINDISKTLPRLTKNKRKVTNYQHQK